MDLYNEDLVPVGQVAESYNLMFNQQMEFALNLLDNKEKFASILQKRLDNTILIECDARKGYRTSLYNTELHKLKFSVRAGAFVSYAKQLRYEKGWKITNGIYIRKGAYDMNNSTTSRRSLPHEAFHIMSCNTELNFDKAGYCYSKMGFQVKKYDEQDNEIDIGLNPLLLTEGTTEMLANMFNKTLKPQAYSFAVFIARTLNCAKTKPTLLETYFSEDINDVKQFFNNFNKSQTYITSNDLISAPIAETFWKDKNCPKIIKGCLEYTINSIDSVYELKEFYKTIKDVIINIGDNITVNIGEEHKDKVVEFIKRSLIELLDKRKQEIINQQNTTTN